MKRRLASSTRISLVTLWRMHPILTVGTRTSSHISLHKADQIGHLPAMQGKVGDEVNERLVHAAELGFGMRREELCFAQALHDAADGGDGCVQIGEKLGAGGGPACREFPLPIAHIARLAQLSTDKVVQVSC